MRIKNYDHISTVILSVTLAAVFAAPATLAEENVSSGAAKGIGDDPVDPRAAAPADTKLSEQKLTVGATHAEDRCDDREEGLAEQTAGVVPYEALSLDYYGLFMRYFETTGC